MVPESCDRAREGGPNMAELRFEAPLASFENEEWIDHEDSVDASLYKCKFDDGGADEQGQQSTQASSEAENFKETCSGSLADLVNSFDERISNCFCNFEEQVEKIAPVQMRSQEEVMDDCQMWWTITGNYGNILPIDWTKDYTKQQPRNKIILLRDKQDNEYPELFQSDEDLPQDFDMHSLIVATLHHEDEDRVETAEDVISQIEYMLKEPATENGHEDGPFSVEDEQHYKLKAMLDKLPSYTESELKGLTIGDLQELVVEYRQANKILAELLASEQAIQDELDLDKELKNTFISLLLAVHKKIRDTSSSGGSEHKKKKKHRGGHGHGHAVLKDAASETDSADEGSSFLTTKIPYFPQDGPPTSEQLQVYIKILEAISQNSSTVPTLLTDYILKVLCPAQ